MNDDSYQIGLLKAINAQLVKSEGMLRNICEISGFAFIYYDFDEKKVHIIGNWSHFFDISSEKVKNLSQVIEYAEEEYIQDIHDILYLEKHSKDYARLECKLKDKDIYAEIVVNVFYNGDNKPLWKAICFKDFTKIRQQREELAYMAYYDMLTGLYNRNYFVTSLSEFIVKAKDNNAIVSVLLIDVDDFRKINDGMGLLEGDDVVQQIGSFLKDIADDNVIVSHFDSDIFCIAIYDPIGRRSVENIVEQIKTHMKEPFSVMNRMGRYVDVNLTVSIGVAEYPESADNAILLINLAEIVMLKAKRRGKNSVIYYDKPIIDEFIDYIEIEKKMAIALKEQKFVMYYQPQFETDCRKLRGVEALVRWIDNDGKIISPDKFIPIAENNGSILLLGEWIIEECISDFAKWNKKYQLKDFLLSINISSLQFKNKNFVKNLIKVIKKYNVSPSNIELEITESVFIDNKSEIVHKMKLLKDFGIKFSMDDFGTGFSSLSYLRELPIDTLKIDKSFIDNVVNDTSTRTIAESIIELSKKLGFVTIAEGVEQEIQYSTLKNIGCENIQGFYLGMPVSFDEIEQLLSKHFD